MDGEKVLRLIRLLSPTKKINKTEWRWLSEEYDLPRPTNCSACGHLISNVVRIAAKSDVKRQLHLGTDCFALLEAEWGGEPLSRGARTSSVLRSMRSRFTARLNDLYASHPFVHEKRGDGSWSHWLLVQSELPSRPMPPDVRAGVAQLKRHRFILDDRLLQACVEFHNRHRKFDARVVLGKDFRRHVASSLTRLTIEEALALRARAQERLDRERKLPPPQPAIPPEESSRRKYLCSWCLAWMSRDDLIVHRRKPCPRAPPAR